MISKKQHEKIEFYSKHIVTELLAAVSEKEAVQLNFKLNCVNGGISNLDILRSPIKKIVRYKKC